MSKEIFILTNKQIDELYAKIIDIKYGAGE